MCDASSFMTAKQSGEYTHTIAPGMLLHIINMHASQDHCELIGSSLHTCVSTVQVNVLKMQTSKQCWLLIVKLPENMQLDRYSQVPRKL